MSARGLLILGATGTIGRNTLDVVHRHPERFELIGLTAYQDVDAMLVLCEQYRPRIAAMADPDAAQRLRERLGSSGLDVEVIGGAQSLVDLAADGSSDLVMSGIVGAAGLLPTLAAVEAGKQVLVANKEPLVMAGRLLLQAARRSNARILPVDSEHNAIFQCLPSDFRCGTAPSGVRRIILTASGGPFRETAIEELAAVTPAQAVRHPNWVMGQKISVDSATMMNKGLELIEARWLFDLPGADIEVVVHPQSTIHSLVEYQDGSMLAQMGHSDMRIPIAHALAWPDRIDCGLRGLDLSEIGNLSFEAADLTRYPCLGLARQALEAGEACCNVLNAANEVAVAAFLNGDLRYLDIAPLLERCLESVGPDQQQAIHSIDQIVGLDQWARARARELMPEVAGA